MLEGKERAGMQNTFKGTKRNSYCSIIPLFTVYKEEVTASEKINDKAIACNNKCFFKKRSSNFEGLSTVWKNLFGKSPLPDFSLGTFI